MDRSADVSKLMHNTALHCITLYHIIILY